MTSKFKPARSTVQLALIAALTAAGAGASSVVAAAEATASASATVVMPIAVTAGANLSFGSFAAGPGGNVTVNTGGVRSTSGPILSSAVVPSAARFDITGQGGLTYAITHGGSTELSNGVSTMALAKFSDLSGAGATSGTAASGVLSPGGTQSLYVGGKLSVAVAQQAGSYSGTVIATVEYN